MKQNYLYEYINANSKFEISQGKRIVTKWHKISYFLYLNPISLTTARARGQRFTAYFHWNRTKDHWLCFLFYFNIYTHLFPPFCHMSDIFPLKKETPCLGSIWGDITFEMSWHFHKLREKKQKKPCAPYMTANRISLLIDGGVIPRTWSRLWRGPTEGWRGINLWSWCYLLPQYKEADDLREGEMRGLEGDRKSERETHLISIKRHWYKPQMASPNKYFFLRLHNIKQDSAETKKRYCKVKYIVHVTMEREQCKL